MLWKSRGESIAKIWRQSHEVIVSGKAGFSPSTESDMGKITGFFAKGSFSGMMGVEDSLHRTPSCTV